MAGTLRELTAEYATLLEFLESSGDDPEAFGAALAELKGNVEHKAENIKYLCQEFDGASLLIDAEIKRLQARKKVADNSKERLKAYVQFSMDSVGLTTIGPRTSPIARIQPGRGSVQVDDIHAVPDQFKEATITLPWSEIERLDLVKWVTGDTMKVKKKAINDNHRSTGETPPGVTIKQVPYLTFT